MTAPKPPDRKEVETTVDRLHGWLQQNGHTKTESPVKLYLQLVEVPDRYLEGSAAAAVARTMTIALGTASLTRTERLNRTIARLRALEPGIAALLNDLTELDRDRAKDGVRATVPTYASLGDAMVAAKHALKMRLEAIAGVPCPVTQSEWARFAGDHAELLRAAGLSWPVIVRLLPAGEGGSAPGERLRNRAARSRKKGSTRK